MRLKYLKEANFKLFSEVLNISFNKLMVPQTFTCQYLRAFLIDSETDFKPAKLITSSSCFSFLIISKNVLSKNLISPRSP